MIARGTGRPDGGRYVTSVGETVPSVSTILGRYKDSSALVEWAKREGANADVISQSAIAVGSCVHDMIEQTVCDGGTIAHYTHDLTAEQAEQARVAFASWRQWYDDFISAHDVEWIATEVPMTSARYRFGGTPDVIARVDGDLAVVDWKTSKGIYLDYVYQCAAYALLWGEAHGEMPTDAIIVQAPKTGRRARVKRVGPEFLGAARKQFLRLRAAYDDDKLLARSLGLR